MLLLQSISFQFLFLLALVFSFEIGTAVAIYSKQNYLNETLDNGFKQILSNHTENAELWSSVQTKVEIIAMKFKFLKFEILQLIFFSI